MNFRIIKAPTSGTCQILQQRIAPSMKIKVDEAEAIGLAQGRLCDMIFATDVAEKATGVRVVDIRGNCPQNLIMVAILGDTSSVELALHAMKKELDNQKNIFQ